jgi:uncharacterized protein YjlB
MEIFHTLIGSSGSFPNNNRLPFVIYRDVLSLNSKDIESLFLKNGWHHPWINGIYPFHHFHSNTHEVLGISRGKAKVQIGGSKGDLFEVKRGDVLFIPAGLSHKKIREDDFECVGAYPLDIQYDMNYEATSVLLENIQKTPLPLTDPVYGEKGPLFEYWK